MEAIKQSILQKLKECGLPYHHIQVFGSIRLNIHVRCVGRATADKWAYILAQVSGSKVSLVQTQWEAIGNRGTSMLPTMISGFLVSVAF